MRFVFLVTLCLGVVALCGGVGVQRRLQGPQIVTEPQELHGEVGGSVTLPCDVANLRRKSVFWMKGETQETRQLVMQLRSIRHRLIVPRQFQQVVRSGKLGTEGTSLVINNLTEEDAGTYTCTITWASQSISHTLHVTDPAPTPEVTVEYDPPSQRATVTEWREEAVLTCGARGYPSPSVTWYRENVEGEVVGEGAELRVEARRENAGQYVCVATNGISQDQSATFTLAVEYLEVEAVLPRVEVRGREREATLSCRVQGHPTPEVVWHRSDSTDLEADHSSDQPDLHHLQLENLVPGDLGDYHCSAHTLTMRDLATVTLVSFPGPARVLGVRPWPRRPQVTITWEVDSLAPIVSFDSTLVKAGTEEMLEVRSEATPVEVDGTRYVLETVLILDPGTTYLIDLQAVNTERNVGPEMDTPFAFTFPHQARLPATDGGVDKEHKWRLFKAALNVLSRLPGVARALQ